MTIIAVFSQAVSLHGTKTTEQKGSETLWL